MSRTPTYARRDACTTCYSPLSRVLCAQPHSDMPLALSTLSLRSSVQVVNRFNKAYFGLVTAKEPASQAEATQASV